MADHKIDGNDGAGNVDLIRRIDAMQACQVGPSDEWAKATKDGYNQAATDCAMAILRVAPVSAANDEMTIPESETDYCIGLRAQLAAANASLTAEIERLRTNKGRFPELMASVMAEKDLSLDDRIEKLKAALSALSPDIAEHQWQADKKTAFGEKYVRNVVGNNGEGRGLQWLATTPPHIKGLANYIAAANPDTVAMLLAQLAAANARADHAEAQLAVARDAALVEAAAVTITRKSNGEATLDHQYDRGYLAACDSCAGAILALRDKPAPAVTVQEAAKVLASIENEWRKRNAYPQDHSTENMSEIWAFNQLRAIAGGNDD